MEPYVFLMTLQKEISPSVFCFLLQFVREDKRQRILNQKKKELADTMLAGELLAMYAIAQVYHIPMAEQRLGQSQEGKPFLINRQDVHFSISHSKNTVAVAVCDTKVGIDIEHITEYRPALARRICTDRERCRIEESENPVAMLVEYWTRKEAAVKMTGDGLKGIFAETSVEYDCTTMQREDFFVTVAWETDGCGKLVF